MRSVPHRVVCLLGLDDGVFPRKAPRDGDDLMLARPARRRPRPAQRGPPAAARRAAGGDRPAGHHLHGQRRAHERPAAAGRAGRRAARRRRPDGPHRGRRRRATACVVRHPLQPFDPRNFVPGALVARPPWSFDRVTLEGARALAGEREPPAPFLAGPLPSGRAGARRARRPRAVRRAPGARVPAPAARHQRRRLPDEVADALPVELDALEQWGVGQRLLEALLAGRGDGRLRPRRDRARRAAARPARACRSSTRVRPIVERDRGRGAGRCSARRRAARLGRRPRRARRRPRARRHGRRRVRRRRCGP